MWLINDDVFWKTSINIDDVLHWKSTKQLPLICYQHSLSIVSDPNYKD